MMESFSYIKTAELQIIPKAESKSRSLALISNGG